MEGGKKPGFNLLDKCAIQSIRNNKQQVEEYWMGSNSSGQYMQAIEEWDSQMWLHDCVEKVKYTWGKGAVNTDGLWFHAFPFCGTW